jgi:ADP-ribose pyrophosphatase YjhB (NUDIX family)
MRIRATSVVLNEDNILMIHRFNHGEEYYVLPGGGVEEGENIETAVTRELQEETSIEAKLKEKILEFTDTRGDHHVLYLCDYISGTPQLHKDSVEANNKDSQQSYRPEWVPINLIDNLTIYPKEEKEFLVNYLK